MKSRELIKLITDDGWYLVKIVGSHHHFKHPTKRGKVSIPHPKDHITIGTKKSVLRQAGLQ